MSQETKKIVWKHGSKRPFYAYAKNQALLETILLYCASKCKQSPKQGISAIYGPTCLPFYEIIIGFFNFLDQDVIIPRSNCAIIAGDSSEKHNLAPFYTQNRGLKTSTF